jgi:hypothetical protein
MQNWIINFHIFLYSLRENRDYSGFMISHLPTPKYFDWFCFTSIRSFIIFKTWIQIWIGMCCLLRN